MALIWFMDGILSWRSVVVDGAKLFVSGWSRFTQLSQWSIMSNGLADIYTALLACTRTGLTQNVAGANTIVCCDWLFFSVIGGKMWVLQRAVVFVLAKEASVTKDASSGSGLRINCTHWKCLDTSNAWDVSLILLNKDIDFFWACMGRIKILRGIKFADISRVYLCTCCIILLSRIWVASCMCR